MLVNPTVQQPGFTAQPAPLPNGGGQGVGQEEVVRSDLPPVTQTPESAQGQNQQLQNTDQGFQQRLVQEGAEEAAGNTANAEDVAAEAPEQALDQNRSNDANSSNGSANDSRAEERAAAEQQRQDEAIIRQLKARDREVRLHEAAHAAVGGRYAGSPQLQFERGPDGVNYAVSGEVSISVSKVSGDPEASLEKARQIRAAALAPAEPSAQDRRVAAEAAQLENEARAEIQAQRLEADRARSERVESTREEEQKEDNVEVEETETETVQEPVVAAQPPQIGPQQNDEEGENNRSESKQSDKNAREQLEEILLGNQTVPQALNEAGLVDTQNPYGKSGFIEFIV